MLLTLDYSGRFVGGASLVKHPNMGHAPTHQKVEPAVDQAFRL